MVKLIKINMLESLKVRFLNDSPNLYRWYIMLLCINPLLYLLLLSCTMGDNTVLSFMSTFPVAVCFFFFLWKKKETIYMDPLKQKGDIFKDNNKKSGIYRWNIKLSGKTYVGSAINLTHRFISYFP